ncbi:hypothetical protein CKA38_14320 [Ereboglobus luteus]|uniref:AAA+ ATPase domain-containing protein n=2 Tax=Ereboglobus luteus TaxID=1796921 RepID=A0A2U8E6Z9_9BACT|nr:hypothetical protein CKA38_14320 [Ereboglobus luteus]
MLARKLEKNIRSALSRFPVVTLVGARQSGKTTLADKIAGDLALRVHFYDLEDPRHALAMEDPLSALGAFEDKLVIIDEAQRMPSLFPVLRVLVDANRRPGRFLLLGSASPDLRRQSAESLAGRVQTLVLRPLTLDEVGGQARLDTLWARGGFPEAFLSADDDTSMEWRNAYLRDLVERDLSLLGFDLPPERMRRFMLLLAHLHGQLWNASSLARTLGIGTNTASRYLDAMSQTLLVRRLEPYYRNLGKRLTKSPKIYLADSGLAHALLGIPDKTALLGHPSLGASWEGFVLQHLDASLPAGWDVAFWRTAAGAEIDFLLLKNGQPEVAIEAKANATHPKPARGFHQGCDDLKINRRWLVSPGNETLALPQGVEVLPLAECLARVREL